MSVNLVQRTSQTSVLVQSKPPEKVDAVFQAQLNQLYLACSRGHSEAVKSLLEMGVKVDVMSPVFAPFYPLDWALAHGKFAIVRQIVEHFERSYEDFLWHKLLANVFGIKGLSEPSPFQTNYEGFNRLLASQKLCLFASAFLNENSHWFPLDVLNGLKRALQEAPNNLSKKPIDLVCDVFAGNLVILYAGSNTHINVVIFYKNLVFKCERGPGATFEHCGVEILEMTNRTYLLHVVADLRHDANTEEGLNLFSTWMNQKLGLKHLQQISLLPHPVGNCGWANSEAAFLALLHAYCPLIATPIHNRWLADVQPRVLKTYMANVKTPDVKLLKLIEAAQKAL